MAYRVLARAYRSGTFDEVVGQEAIATTLKNAITGGRVHHGYLFTGTRGVGKTSMARILAKSLNCLTSDTPTVTPCRDCDSCKAVAIGEDIDVVEIDAASNTGVDNIRDLRSNATLRPARARFKIYIIDEVHMLSAGAFNALLKTLEEPPPHVKFILATTEAHKVPATIQSRCQRFDFRAISVSDIAEHLAGIAKAENIEVEDGVLRRIARLANGSMRDALSLLDMLLAYDAEHLTREVVDRVIPPPHDELSMAVMDAVAQRDAAKALTALNAALQSGRTVERFCDHLIDHVRTLMLMQVCGADTDLADVSETLRSGLAKQSQRFDAPTFVYMINLLEELRRSAKYSGAARALADAAVVRLAMSAQFSDIGELMTTLCGDEGGVARVQRDAAGGRAGVAKASGPPAPSKKNETVDRIETKREPSSETLFGEMSAAKAAGPSGQSTGAGDEASEGAAEELPGGLGHSRMIQPDQWDRAARDPWVERVRQAVDGTLLDIHPPRTPSVRSVGSEADRPVVENE